jgi:hypothetical protein
VKSAVPYRDTGIAGKDTEWSKPNLSDFTSESWDDLSNAEKRRIAAHYAWSAAMPPESFGDLKLPHHQAGKSGVGKAVWNGVKAAMGALNGARGGVDLNDKQAVYSHLSKHYAQFEEEPPPLKALVLLSAIEESLDWIETDKPDLYKIEDISAKLQELNELLRTEPPDPALILRAEQEKLFLRLAVKKRQLVTLH